MVSIQRAATTTGRNSTTPVIAPLATSREEALRIYDAAAGMWRVAWVSNSGGGGSGAVFGSFEARFESGEIVMRGSGAAGIGEQRIAFSDMTDQSFRWRSEYSQDGGASWTTFMRLTAHRIE